MDQSGREALSLGLDAHRQLSEAKTGLKNFSVKAAYCRRKVVFGFTSLRACSRSSLKGSGANSGVGSGTVACRGLRSSKYLNKLIEQDHRGIKSRTRPMLGFKSFDSAFVAMDGIELLRRIYKC